MIKAEVTLAICLSLIGISWESPFSQYQSPYSFAHNPFSSSHRSHSAGRPLFEPDSRYNDRLEHDLDRSESRHPVRHRSNNHHQAVSHVQHPDHSFSPANLDQDDPMRNKRQAFLPYFPYYSFVPPIYQVHNIILTPPGYNCYPSRPSFDPRPPVTSRPPVKRPDETSGGDDGIGTRFGEEDNKNTTTPTKQAPSKCVWSIVACCSPGSRDIRYACFELLGCPGAFWDVNPCDDKVVTAAANSALRYYMNNQSPTPEPTFQNL